MTDRTLSEESAAGLAAADQLRSYLALRREHGPERARELALTGMPERQAARMGDLLAAPRLLDALAPAAPALEALGLPTDFLDVSTETEDAVIEVMVRCPCRMAAESLGLASAESVICDLDATATERAFPGLRVRALARQTEGRRVCAFRFSRPRPAAPPGVAQDTDAPDRRTP